MKITIVDKNDNVIGSKERGTLDLKDIYRVSALWIKNSKGESLLAKRHRNKLRNPGMWGPSVSGTVEEGETYEKNIIKEAEEELGLKNIDPQLSKKTRTKEKNDHFTQWYILVSDKKINEFKIQEAEVQEIKWFSKEELLEGIKKNPKDFLPTMKKYADLFA